jgi:acetyl-CoA carboxylase alpha subunit
VETLEMLEVIDIDKLLEQRYRKLMAFGHYREG